MSTSEGRESPPVRLSVFFPFCLSVRLFFVDTLVRLTVRQMPIRFLWFLSGVLTMAKSLELTEKQREVANFIVSESQKLGRGIGTRDLCRKFGWGDCDENGVMIRFNVNSPSSHLKGIREKTGQTLIMWETLPNGDVKPNSLRAASMAGAGSVQNSPNCRNGSGWSIVVVDNEVAFTIFSEMGIVKHDRIALVDAIGYCDKFKIPADLAVIERVSMLAEKQAKMAALAAAKVTA